MAVAQFPLIFFMPSKGSDPVAVARAIVAGSSPESVDHFNPIEVLKEIKSGRGFGRLKIALPKFTLDNAGLEASLEGTAMETHLSVCFYGNFDKLAKPLFDAVVAQGFACYSVWDTQLLERWPVLSELTPDSGYADRMSRVLQREKLRLEKTEPDRERRTKLMNAFVNSPEFRAEMAREARLESPNRQGGKKTYADHMNCFVRWKDGHPSASELSAIRKLDSKFAAMSISDLRQTIGDSRRFQVITAAPPMEVAALRAAAAKLGLAIDVEPP
jgi:hypothetical protein